MANLSRNFIAGRMNKIVDERLVPQGEYIDAMNIRMGSTENSEVGVIENTKGNLSLTQLRYLDGTPLSADARCIGAIEDSANETIYWFVHDSNFPVGATGKLDLIVSYNINTNILIYHIFSIDDGNGVLTYLNFNENYLITGVNIINDLLFFTDDYNPPRFINTKRNYPNPIAYIDQFDPEAILVIKRPPTESPVVQNIITGTQSNYMETRFLSFAYRYKYIDGEYSATSQWSDIAFIPKDFSFSTDSYLNEGMVNLSNTAIVSYNSGSHLVVGIDLLFKQSNNNIIKVIEKLDKQELGLSNDTTYQYTFSNSKIFTILQESELLRLYDNVPRFAKAQTIMGNRLMYGNYVEGYDLIDKNGNPIKLEYNTDLIIEEIGLKQLSSNFSNITGYLIDVPHNVNNAVANVDLTGVDLVQGALISIAFTFNHESFTGDAPLPTEETGSISLSFTFILPQDYVDVYQMVSSAEFQNAVGTASNIKPVFSYVPGDDTSCDGLTFTDQVNCAIPNTLATANAFGSVTKFASGVNAIDQPLQVQSAGNVISFKLIAMQFVDDTASLSQYVYEYYKFVAVNATYQKIASPRSLHSNRGYEIGIVYMDEFNRASTALVSPYNTEHVPCAYSQYKNSIQVIIPPTQIAPYWAKRYKLVIKPDQENYEVIYCNLYFNDPDSNDAYLLLEGENSRKVEVGDRLIVKADSNGPTQSCVYATILDKQSQQENFITPASGSFVPAGVYARVNPNSFSVVEDPEASIEPGLIETSENNAGDYPTLVYPMNVFNSSTGLWEDYTVPAGSRINFYVKTQRLGVDCPCERRIYTLVKNFVSTTDYPSMYDWFIGDNIASSLNDGLQDVDCNQCLTDNVFIPGLGPITSSDLCKNYYRFDRNGTTNQLYLQIRGTLRCGGVDKRSKRRSTVFANIKVLRSENLLIFETEPSEALPDVWYENELSFEIDADGNHMGNIQNEDIALGIPAIVDTDFFNCFAFGNGAESYKIRDSIVGKPFNLGQRVNTVSAQDYKAADRFADITYSGIYNPESNVNKLNEFNLGLLNYKYLEASFGSIYILDGRETDVLTLQEDKISYVLAGKNLLSDSAAGGAITSVPEVLGTQIARTEKYGISFNPESYVQWGFNRFFTDVKRGVVIQMMGNSYSNEQLKVISDSNMRTWFRDTFNESFNTQKLGGFDPYMNEYVLTTNDRKLPINEQCVACGVSQTLTLVYDPTLVVKKYCYCVDLGPFVGVTDINWSVVSNSGGTFYLEITYNGNTFTTTPQLGSGSYTFTKDSISVETATICIYQISTSLVLNITADCPLKEQLKIIEVVVTSNSDAGKNIHTEYRYTNGSFIGALQSNLVVFTSGTASPLVSRYNVTTGYAGSASFPPAGSVMTLQTNKIPPDDFDFSLTNNRFKYLRSYTLYNNTPTEIQDLLSVSNLASPITNIGNIFKADFTVPSTIDGDTLYLIWDLRQSVSADLCFTDEATPDPLTDVCCYCGPCNTDCITMYLKNKSSTSGAVVEFPDGECGSSALLSVSLDPGEEYFVCINNSTNYDIVKGNVVVALYKCGCDIPCLECGSTWTIVNVDGDGLDYEYQDCYGATVTGTVSYQEFKLLCVLRGTTPIAYPLPGKNYQLYKTQECGCCSESKGQCVQWEIKNVTSDAEVEYLFCNGSRQTVTVLEGNTAKICVTYTYLPQLLSGDAEIVTSSTPCNCKG
jgi:hypothetical protein